MTRHSAGPLVDLTQIAQVGRSQTKLRIRRATRPTPPTLALTPYALTKAQAAAFLGVSVRTIEAMLADQRLPSFRLGGRRLIRRLDCEAYADRQTAAQPQKDHSA